MPGEFEGRKGPFVDHPRLNDPSFGPYYRLRNYPDPPYFEDNPLLGRIQSEQAGVPVSFVFETCLVCARQFQGREDVILACFDWGYSFTADPSQDRLKSIVFRRWPDAWFTRALRNDFPNYRFMVN
jgi:hypothetical protein